MGFWPEPWIEAVRGGSGVSSRVRLRGSMVRTARPGSAPASARGGAAGHRAGTLQGPELAAAGEWPAAPIRATARARTKGHQSFSFQRAIWARTWSGAVPP